jgi:signal transduction histidine kinase/CheY-like chemotaxis protein
MNIFDTAGFPARWKCGVTWSLEPWWGWIHISSDVLIWISYFAIPLMLIFYLRKKGDSPFPWLLALFALFILLCGTTHLVDAVIFYWPIYKLSGLLKSATALVSLTTVVALFQVIPKAMLLKSPLQAEKEIDERTAELQGITKQLKQEIEGRERLLDNLQENREMLKLAMTAGDTGFFSWDLSTDRISFDQAHRKLTGTDASQSYFTAHEFFDRIESAHQGRVRAAVDECIATDQPLGIRFPYHHGDGRWMWLEGRGRVLRDSDGRAKKLIGLNQDVTDQVMREQVLDSEAAQAKFASQQKNRFIAQVSHEIRTPLTAMLGCIDSLLMSLEQGETRDTLGVVRSQGELLQVLVNDVLDLSRMEAGRIKYEPKPVGVANVFADVWSLMNPLAQEKGLSIRWLAETKLPETIIGDRNRLKQVFVNLIGNAIKFTEQGSITIVARLDSVDTEGYVLVIEVRDSGCGIPRDKLDIVFEEYVQAGEERSGAGLGLAICKRLVSLMGGTISVRSEVGLGSAFTVRIPIGSVDEEKLVAIDTIASGLDAEWSGHTDLDRLPLKILAAEDTRAIQFVLKRMLGNLVNELVIVQNGRQAVENVMDAEKSDDPFDLVLMDIQMPEVDGIEATRQLRREGFLAPIIALTAGAMESERQASMTAGCTHFLAKPIDLRELRRMLQSIQPRERGDQGED